MGFEGWKVGRFYYGVSSYLKATLDLRVALSCRSLCEELLSLLLGPAQQSLRVPDCCAGPRSIDQRSSQKNARLSLVLPQELPAKHRGKLQISLRGALVSAARPGAEVFEGPRLMCRAEEQRSALLAEKCTAFRDTSPGAPGEAPMKAADLSAGSTCLCCSARRSSL